MPEQDVDGGPAPAGRGEQRLRDAVVYAAADYGHALEQSPQGQMSQVRQQREIDENIAECRARFYAALDRFRDYIAVVAAAAALREQPCRSLKIGDCLTLAVEHPELGGEHDMCDRCKELAVLAGMED